MALRISVLGSGSSGNSTLIANARDAILVDAGFSCKALLARMAQLSFDPHRVSAILISHEHIDHVRGAGVFARKFNVPVFATKKTLHKAQNALGNLPDVRVIRSGQAFQSAGFHISPFSVSHDAVDPVAFSLEMHGLKVGVCTDLGCVTHLVRERLKGSNALVLEMNHDTRMLMAGPYPWELKQRIRSRIGHLSNDAASKLLLELQHAGLQVLFPAHLSGENNLPELAVLAAEQALNSRVQIQPTSQKTATDFFDLSAL